MRGRLQVTPQAQCQACPTWGAEVHEAADGQRLLLRQAAGPLEQFQAQPQAAEAVSVCFTTCSAAYRLRSCEQALSGRTHQCQRLTAVDCTGRSCHRGLQLSCYRPEVLHITCMLVPGCSGACGSGAAPPPHVHWPRLHLLRGLPPHQGAWRQRWLARRPPLRRPDLQCVQGALRPSHS